MTQESKITRQEIIVVDTTYDNSYGDLLFTDKAGTEYKIGNKRRKFFDAVIQPDVAVQLNYSTAYGKEYIYNAVQVELPAPQPKPLPNKVTIVPKAGTPPGPGSPPAEPAPKSEKARVSKDILLKDIISMHTMCLSYAKDMAVQGLIAVDGVTPLADQYLDWLMKKLSKWL